jgi:hypothetical protein
MNIGESATEALRWRSSSFCTNSSCVEVCFTKDGVLVRDSKNPQGRVLAFTRAVWRDFIVGVKNGEFDTP